MRKNAGFPTQDALGNALGVDGVTVGRWENGTRQPRIGMILKIAKTLNAEPGEIIAVLAKVKEEMPA